MKKKKRSYRVRSFRLAREERVSEVVIGIGLRVNMKNSVFLVDAVAMEF